MTISQQLRQAYRALPTNSRAKRAARFVKRAVRDLNTWRARNKRVQDGVNIIGFAKGDFGLGEHIRLVTNAIHTTPINFAVNAVPDPGGHTQSNEEISRFITKQSPYKINLFCFNASDVIAYAQSPLGGIAQSKHYNIGYGYWELSKFPAAWTEQSNYLHEIWAPSRFIQGVLEKSTTRPVHYMPIPVDFENPVGPSRLRFNLPSNRYLFLFTFDLSSHMARKNPQAVIQAFTQAFPPNRKDKVGLVIKITSLKSQPGHATTKTILADQICTDSRIQLIDQTLDRTSTLELIHACDAYTSLHRSEGFGLGMAEAMKMGKLVIATHYSGNKDFMNETNSCPVKYNLVKVDKSDYWLVEDGAEWAEPDIDHAAYYMRTAYENQAWSTAIGRMAMQYIRENHSFHAIGLKYRKRISEILGSGMTDR